MSTSMSMSITATIEIGDILEINLHTTYAYYTIIIPMK
jgi:hypothetical protein